MAKTSGIRRGRGKKGKTAGRVTVKGTALRIRKGRARRPG
jgi:hypothetical protein